MVDRQFSVRTLSDYRMNTVLAGHQFNRNPAEKSGTPLPVQ